MKEKIIENIGNIITAYGGFDPLSIDGMFIIKIENENNNFTGLVTLINLNGIQLINFDPEIVGIDDETINIFYNDLPEEVLKEILFICKLYETDCLETLKRIS